MATSAARPPSVGTRGWFYLAAVGGLILVAGALIAYHLLTRDRSVSDPEAKGRLQTASLPELATAAVGAWPQWRGPNRDGVSAETGLLTHWPQDGPSVLWRAPAGLGYSGLAVAGGRVYTLLQTKEGEQGKEAVICWDAASPGEGRVLWRFAYDCAFDNEQGAGPRSTPTVDGDHVYAVGATGVLTCLKANTDNKDGARVWQHDLVKEFGARIPRWGLSFSPLVDGDLVYALPGGPDEQAVIAFNKHDGRVVWHSLSDLPGYSSPVLTTAAGKRQLLCFLGEALVSLDPATGKEFWRYPWKTAYECNIATPIAVGNYVFISSGYGKGCALMEVVAEPNDSAGARFVYENNRMCNHFSSSVYYKEHVYGFNEGTLTCMNLRTEQVRWKEKGFKKGSLLIADGHLVILGESGRLALAKATPDGYVEEAACELRATRCWTPPALADGKLYIRLLARSDDGNQEGQVLCLKVK
jgi:outer membrane protein assembly factor BamB